MYENRTGSGENRFHCSQLMDGENAIESGIKNVSFFYKTHNQNRINNIHQYT